MKTLLIALTAVALIASPAYADKASRLAAHIALDQFHIARLEARIAVHTTSQRVNNLTVRQADLAADQAELSSLSSSN